MLEDSNFQTMLERTIKTVVEHYGTPLYVYVKDVIRYQLAKVKRVFEGVRMLPTFACKANNNPRLIQLFLEEGFGTDIVSLGEYHASELAGVPRERIVWNGNGKTKAEMGFLKDKVGFINVDSVEEAQRWADFQSDANFFIRINPDVDPRTHPHISTGIRETKFGVHIDLIDEALSVLRKQGKKVLGFHIHIGSQITEVEPFLEAISIGVELSKKYGFGCINIGGGWGINYSGKELNLEEYRSKVVPLFSSFELVIIELGRYLIGPAGILVAKVEYVKRTPYKTFVVLDVGMNALVRPAMYGAHHGVHVLEPEEPWEESIVDVVGPLCETGDVIARNRSIPIPKCGSLMIVEDVGAYGFSMASNYNSHPRPAEVLIDLSTNEIRLIRRRESIEDLFRNVE
ncbi:diaminopimelate decarboxylase [Fervidobacterium thailandense]|nr:diaminopimelate decarboxylase [Fervidobacterium thailandense]